MVKSRLCETAKLHVVLFSVHKPTTSFEIENLKWLCQEITVIIMYSDARFVKFDQKFAGHISYTCTFLRSTAIRHPFWWNLDVTVIFICCRAREQGCHGGESSCLPLVWPGFDSQCCHVIMWIEFVAGSCPCSKGFSPGTLFFHKNRQSQILI